MQQKSNDRAIEAVIGIRKKESIDDEMHIHNNYLSDQYMPLQPAPIEQAKKKEPFQLFQKADSFT